MYFLGHAAFAYVPIAAYCLARGVRLQPTTVLVVLFFANLPDTIHFGPVRWLSHNTVGALLMFALFFVLFRRMGLVRNEEMPYLGFAVGMHVLSDTLFSSFILFFPFSVDIQKVFGFGSEGHIMAEAVMAPIFLAMLLASGDWRRLRAQVSELNKRFWRAFNPLWLRRRWLYPQYLYLLVGVLSIFQMPLSLRVARWYDEWFSWAFAAMYVCYVATYLALLAPNKSPNFKDNGSPRP
jgi:hypothetical protein